MLTEIKKITKRKIKIKLKLNKKEENYENI